MGWLAKLNRSAVSIPSNIAEGAGRNSKGEFKNFLGNASGSSFELETQLRIANDLKYISFGEYERLSKKLDIIQKMIYN